MPISSALYEVCLANSNLGGGVHIGPNMITREKKGTVLEVVRINILWKIRGYVID